MSHHPTDRKAREKRAQKTLSLTSKLLERGKVEPARCVEEITKRMPKHLPCGFEIKQEHAFAQDIALDLPDRSGVLIFGSSTKPGGGWLNGAKAQEEDISLASTWGLQARLGGEEFYTPRGSLGGVGPDKILCADGFWLSNGNGSPLVQPKPVSFISIAAPNLGNPKAAGLSRDERVDRLARRLATALDQWRLRKTPHLLLGAIGCGVFKWKPEDSASALGIALSYHSRIHGSIPEITLSMPDIEMGKVFTRVLKDPKLWRGSLVLNQPPSLKRPGDEPITTYILGAKEVF